MCTYLFRRSPHLIARIWFVERFLSWSSADFVLRRLTASCQVKVSSCWDNVGIFYIPLGCPLEVYVPVPKWTREMEPSPILVGPSPTAFAYYSKVLRHGFADDLAQI